MRSMRYALLVGIVLPCLSCSRADMHVQVRGRVLVNGQPASGVQVIFHPQNPAEATAASGVTKDDGSFTLMSGLNAGLQPGTYRVTALWPDPDVQATEQDRMMGLAEPGPDLFRGKYAALRNTRLSVEIRAETTELPPLELSLPET